MFGFGWVRTHLGVVFDDAFRLCSSVGLRQGVAKRRLGQALGTPRRSKATSWLRPTPQRSSATLWLSIVHRHVFLSCFAIPLFRGLVYWTNEDPISV